MDKGGSVETNRAPTFYGLLYEKMDEQGRGPAKGVQPAPLHFMTYLSIIREN